MSNLPAQADLKAGGVNRDYATIFQDIQRLIPQYCPEWTYQGDDDAGTAILQLLAYLADHLHYRNDTTLRDLRPSKTIYRHLLREYAEWLGYFPQRPTPAQVDCTLSLDDGPQAKDVVIEAPFQASATGADGSTVYFESTSEITIPAGESEVSATLVEGETVSGVVLGTATGEPFERFVLDDAQAIFNQEDTDFVVQVDGIEAKLVRWAVEAQPDELVYWVRERRDRTLQIRFGDGTYGSTLTPGSQVTITYRRGGGVRGRVQAGAVNRVLSPVFLDGVQVAVSITNPARSIGGMDEESIEEIRQNTPAFFRTQNRAVSREDYEVLAQSVPGVFRSRVVTVGVGGVIVYVVPDGAEEGSELTNALKSSILTSLQERKMATDWVDVALADLVPVDVQLDITAFPGERNAIVRHRVYQLFADPDTGILSAPSNDLGTTLRLSDMVGAVEDIQGVDYVDVHKYTRRPSFAWISRMGDANISEDGVTIGVNTREQVWHVEFLDATTFSVVGSLSGRQAAIGTLDVPYSDSDSEIAFTIESGATPMSRGDRAEIRVGKLAWNISFGPNEFPVLGKLILKVSGGIE